MPVIQSLFYFAGFIAFILAALFFSILLVVALKNVKRFRVFLDKVEEKMDAPLITVLLPFLPTLISLFGEFKRSRKSKFGGAIILDMKTKSKSVLRYRAIFDPCQEGGFTVTVPKLPGLVTEGDTYEEALKNTRDAILGYLEILKSSHEPIPEPDQNTFTADVDINFGKPDQIFA